MIPLLAVGLGGLGLGSFVGGQVDDALDNGSGGGFPISSLVLGLALVGVLYVVLKK